MRSYLPIVVSIGLVLGCEAPFEKTSDQLLVLRSPSETGVTFSNDIREDNRLNYMFYQSIYNGAGVGVADLDNDGLEDLFFAGNQVPDRLYHNLGELQFEDVSTKAGIISDKGWSTGVAIADIDGNGYKDIYVSRFLLEDSTLRANKLYMNQGQMKFIEKAEEMGLADQGYTIQAAFLDYDLDGDLDIYVVNQPPNHSSRRIALKGRIDYSYTDKLYRNDGDTFNEVTEEAGITNFAYGLSAICSDINEDGWPDIYVSCDFDEPDLLYINQQDGSFKEMAEEQLQHMSNFSMGADIADFNNDGLLDIFTADMVAEDNKRLKTNMSGMNPKKFWSLVDSGYHHQYMFNALQLNRGEGHFSEIAQLAGISATDWSWSTLFSDFDMDGDKDLLITNGLKRDVRNNDFNIARRKKVRALEAEAKKEGKKGISINPLELLALSPSAQIGNYFYENEGDLTFSKAMDKWGATEKMISHGAALSDLDNDGDVDLILNNMDEAASIYENKRESYVDHHWISIALDHPQLIGTRVTVFTSSGLQTMECLPVRGYMSTSTEKLHFGLGEEDKIEKLVVRWSDGVTEEYTDLSVDREHRLSPGKGKSLDDNSITKSIYSASDAIDFQHEENEFDDFATEILIPHRMSTIGPCMCKGDINGDGLEDLYIGGAIGRSGRIFIQHPDGSFGAGSELGEAKYEDTGCAIFDADGDGQNDLYVVSGGNEEREDLSHYQDRLYLNQGSGQLMISASSLPEITQSGKAIEVADYDADGDLDIFIGGRQIPGKYPYPPDSKLLINEDGKFSDRTSDLAPAFEELGMVTDALWHDRDGDGDLDLTVVGEWMPISFFEQREGELIASGTVPNSVGWWNVIAPIDIDQDGDEDYVVGNLGLNIKYKASPEEPFQIFSADFDENGSNDIYMAYYQEGQCFPVRGRECSSQQLPFVKKKFPTYDEFGEASVYEVLGADTAGALNYQAQIFESVMLIDEGQSYRMEALPIEAQFSVVNSVLIHDMDGDGQKDLFLAGNHFDREVETTRSDASYGVYLQSDGSGRLRSEPLSQLGIYAGYDVRDLCLIEGQKRNLIIIANNDDQVRSFAENQVSE